MELKPKLASTVSEPFVLTDDLEELLAGLGGGANLEGQAKAGRANGAEM